MIYSTTMTFFLRLKKLWHHIDRDPKLLKFLELSTNAVLKANHLIVFTESKETANYLLKNIKMNNIRIRCCVSNT